ncbi:hypothetical protein [Halodesulfovibrio sp.]|uniref:hypothetical protein n=1 Tax=Halodesulfovibrio sp. TaxID=1912772 RepID=UPI0025EC2CBD|nr:hypothetical protein [Halodesulfovibrio sp.]MCT4627958.1 hypothetical protein [Halodesulfovibrio sp.]
MQYSFLNKTKILFLRITKFSIAASLIFILLVLLSVISPDINTLGKKVITIVSSDEELLISIVLISCGIVGTFLAFYQNVFQQADLERKKDIHITYAKNNRPDSEKRTEQTSEPYTQQSLFDQISQSLTQQVLLFDRKASIMLEQGIKIAISGVLLLLATIILWNYFLQYLGSAARTEHFIGIVSCSLVFVFLQALAVWCLKQHRAYVDASLYVTKIRSIFERKMQAYLLIKEFSQGKEGYHKLLDNFLTDIEWPPEPLSAKQQTSYAKEAAATLTEVTKSLRVLHAAHDKPASSHRRYPNPSR